MARFEPTTRLRLGAVRSAGRAVERLNAGVALLAVMMLGPAGLAVAAVDAVVTPVRIVNMSGRDVRVRVLADDREVLVEEVSVGRGAAGRSETGSPAPPHPTRELKVLLPRGIERLTVEELHVGARATFDLPRETRSEEGFSITVRPDGISVTRDYRAPRSR